MKSLVRLLAVGILASLGGVTPALAQTAAPIGTWDGVVSVSNGTVDIPFKFERSEERRVGKECA